MCAGRRSQGDVRRATYLDRVEGVAAVATVTLRYSRYRRHVYVLQP